MKCIFFSFAALLLAGCAIHTSAQTVYQSWENYQLVFDDSTKTNSLVNTATGTVVPINPLYSNYPRHYFQHGFVVARTGDMRMLYNLNGDVLLKPCHYILFDESRHLIKAYECGAARWIFLSFDGDTVSYAQKAEHNYCPTITETRNVAIDQFTQPYPGHSRTGYLDEAARWVIPAIFEEAQPFENQRAMVKFDGKWGLIDEQGKWLTLPTFETTEALTAAENDPK